MKTVKRIIIVFLVCFLIFGLLSCKKKKEEQPKDSELQTSVPTVDDISFLDYTVVRPENVSEKFLGKITDFYNKLKAVEGASVKLSTDWLAKNETPDSEAKEILIGNTNRPESEQIRSQLTGSEYAIAVVGNKIVIVGASDNITVDAIKYFSERYLSQDTDGKIEGDLFYKAKANVATVIENGKARYTLIGAENESDIMNELMYRLYDSVKEITGIKLGVGSDKLNAGQSYNSDTLQILFGNTAYDETKLVKAETAYEGYTIDYVGNKIVIFAHTAEGMQEAVEAFLDVISFSTVKNSDESVTVSLVKERISGTSEGTVFFKEIPLSVEERSFDSIYDAGDNTLQLYWSDSLESGFSSYISELEKLGFSKYQSLDNTSIASATYVKDKASVHVYYLKRTNELRVLTQNGASLPINSYEYTEVCSPLVTQLGLDYSTGAASGMGYLIRLSDGTFVVIDGGHDLDTNSDNLYSLMLSQKPNEVEDVVISAWFMSHAHDDHYGCYNNFARRYADRVTVKALVGNDLPTLVNGITDTPENDFPCSQRYSAFKDCVYIKAHTGQQFFFPGVTMSVLYTHEDVYPKTMRLFNSFASMVVDAKIEDTRFLWFADVQQEAAKVIEKMYAEDLKCDVMQVAHHGSHGGSLALYKYCSPDIAFWPYQEKVFVELEQNAWLLENVQQMIWALDGNYSITFEKLPTINEMQGSVDENTEYSKFY